MKDPFAITLDRLHRSRFCIELQQTVAEIGGRYNECLRASNIFQQYRVLFTLQNRKFEIDDSAPRLKCDQIVQKRHVRLPQAADD
jgi:hypothetical protein